jgi:hypothetical protein
VSVTLYSRVDRRAGASAEVKRPRTKAERLAAAAQAAADVRAYDTNPDVIAYRIERTRAWVDRLIWTGLVLGLAFTMANVQHFAAQGAEAWSIPWLIAWLLDPMVSLVLVGVLLGEQVIARHGIRAGRWVRRTKWTALACTYAMNTWSAWADLDPAAILLHSVPPLIVFCAAEAVTTLKHQITEAVHQAYGAAVERARTEVEVARTEEPAEAGQARTEPQGGPVRQALASRTDDAVGDARTEAAPVRAEEPSRTEPVGRQIAPSARTGVAAPVRTEESSRTVLADPMARDVAVELLRRRFLEAIERGESKWSPPYEELVEPSLRSRSWWEKAWREARLSVISPADAEPGDPAESQSAGSQTAEQARTRSVRPPVRPEVDAVRPPAGPEVDTAGTDESAVRGESGTDAIDARTGSDSTRPVQAAEPRTDARTDDASASVPAVEPRTGAAELAGEVAA